MPVQYRMFYIRKLIHMKDKEKMDMDKAYSDAKEVPSSNGKISKGPGINRQ